MKRKFLILVIAILALALGLTSCDDGKTVSALTVVDGTLTTEYEIGATPDFSGVKAVVTYSDGTAETVTSDKLNIGTIDTSTEGVKKLSISFDGFGIEVDITVKAAGGNEGGEEGGNEGGEEGGETATLVGIELVDNSYPKTIPMNDVYTAPDIQVKALYSDNTFTVLGMANVTMSLVDTSALGETTLTVSYGGFTANAKITVVGVESAIVDANSIASLVNVGETLDTTQLKIVVTYTDKVTAIIGADKLSVSALDMTKLGKQKITITYLGFSVEYEIYVNDVVSIELDETTVADSVYYGGTLDTTGIKINAKYHNDTVKIFDMASGKFTVEFAGTSAAGSKDLVVKYGSLTDKKTITVIGVESMSIPSSVAKEIMLGGAFTATTLPVDVKYTNGVTEQIAMQFTGSVDTTKVGANVLKFAYLDKTLDFTVNVYGVKSMVVDSSVPDSLILGGEFGLTTLKVIVTYTNNTTATLDLAYTGSVNNNAIGDNVLKVTYLDKEITHTVNVYGVESMAVDSSSVPSSLIWGSEFDLNTLKVIVKYTNNNTATLDLAYTGEVDTSEVGDNVLTVTYLNKTITHTVNVYGVESMTVDSSVISEIKRGETFSLTTLKVNVVYTNNTTASLDLAFDGEVDTSAVGDNVLTVEYLNKEITYTVKVYGVTGIELELPTADATVTEGTTPSLDNLKVYVVYGNSSNDRVLVSDYTTTLQSLIDAGAFNDDEDDILTVTYIDEYEDEQTATLTFSSIPPVITEIVVNEWQKKILKGESYTKSLVTKVTVLYNNGTSEIVSDFTIGELDTAEIGDKILTVNYGGLSKGVTVTVREVASLTIEGIASSIYYGETLDESNLKVKATYTDNESEYITGFEKTGINNTTVAAQNFTVTYRGVSKSATVTVIGVDTMSVITSDTVKDKLLLMESFNKSDIKVSVKYTNGATATVDYSKLTITGDEVNANQSGTYNVSIAYLDKTITYSVRVYGITSFTIASSVTLIDKGQDFLGQLTVTVVYEDNYKTVTLNSGEYELVGSVNKDAAGTYTLTAKYKGQEASVNVVVRELLSLELSTNVSLINKGETWNGSVTVVAVYSNGDRITLNAGDYTLTGSVNGSVAGNHVLTASYNGKEGTVTVHVKGVSGIEILNAPVFVNFASTFDKSNILIKVYFTNDTYTTIPLSSAGVAITGDIDSTNVNGNYYAPFTQYFSVSYEGVSASVPVDVRPIKLIMIVFGTFKNELFVGDTFDVSNTVISVVYMDGDPDPTNDLGYLVYYGTPGFNAVPIDTSTAGDKAYAVTYIYMTQTYPVHVKGVKQMILSPGSVPTMLNLGKDLDLSKIKINVQFTNEMWTTLYFNDIQIVQNIDKNTVGKQTLIVSYRGATLEIEIEVADKSQAASDFIFGVSLPDALVARDTYILNFKIQENSYVVGDDNKYYFYLELLQLDKNDNIIDIAGINVASEVEVYIKRGEEWVLLTGTELESYVAVNANENSYDFVDGVATGETFKLRIRPANTAICAAPDTFWREHIVTVVDAYNIYHAKELNIMTNSTYDVNGLEIEGEIIQSYVVDEFLANNNIAKPQTLAGIVIHDNIDIKKEDVPDAYYHKYTDSNGAYKEEFYDFLGVFDRRLNTGETFTMYGNYYSIFSYNLPSVVAKGYANNTDGNSNAQLFNLGFADGSYPGYGNFNPASYVFNIVDMAFRDNDPNSNDQSASERHMRGLICFKPVAKTLNLNNVNIDAFYVSTCPGSDQTVLNITDSKLYNAWQGHIFVWSSNWENEYILNGDPSNYPSENHNNVKINITNSLLAKCGGPVILAQTASATNSTIRSGVDVVVDDKSELYSYVTGQEAWFVAINQTALAGQIVAMNQLIQMSLPEGVSASYTSNQKIVGVNTINMIMVNMGGGMPTGGYVDYEGSLKIGGTMVLNQNDYDKVAHDNATNPYLQGYIPIMSGMGAPVFQSSAGQMYVPAGLDPTVPYDRWVNPGTAFSDGATGIYSNVTTDEYGNITGFIPADPTVFQGDYITLYFMGMGIALEYYH